MDHFVWDLDPVLFTLGPVTIYWYGLIFASAILVGYSLMSWIYRRENQPAESLDSLLIYAVLGIIIGARLGHVLFYDPAYYLSNPLEILAVWEGGLASHGGGIGLFLAVYLFCRKTGQNYLWLLDRLAVPTAMFGFFVRTGNFFNSEIVGTPTNVPWAIVFARIDDLARHPTQLYEACSYLAIFALLFCAYRFTKIKQFAGALLGLLLILVFSARFLLEFVKTQQEAYATGVALTTGQLLSIPFLLAGVALLVCALRKPKRAGTN